MPKWLRDLIFNAVRAYSYLRRNFYTVMDQLAAMLARTAMPSSTPTAGGPSTSTEALSSATPLLSGGADDTSDRKVCNLI
jgi:hypothetical protein